MEIQQNHSNHGMISHYQMVSCKRLVHSRRRAKTVDLCQSIHSFSSSRIGPVQLPRLLLVLASLVLPYEGIPSSWFASATAPTHLIRSGAYNSAPGLMLLMTLISSRIPALMILIPSFPPNASPYRKSVVPNCSISSCSQSLSAPKYVPQSPQKQEVILLPLSAVLLISFGVPLTNLNCATGTTMLFE